MTFRNSFTIGDRVEKYKGGYTAIGTVIAAGKTSSGAVRYMVEYDVPVGLLHIHSDNDLRAYDLTRKADFPDVPKTISLTNGLALHIEQYGTDKG